MNFGFAGITDQCKIFPSLWEVKYSLECVTLQGGSGYKCICQKMLDRILEGCPSHIGQNCEQHTLKVS